MLYYPISQREWSVQCCAHHMLWLKCSFPWLISDHLMDQKSWVDFFRHRGGWFRFDCDDYKDSWRHFSGIRIQKSPFARLNFVFAQLYYVLAPLLRPPGSHATHLSFRFRLDAESPGTSNTFQLQVTTNNSIKSCWGRLFIRPTNHLTWYDRHHIIIFLAALYRCNRCNPHHISSFESKWAAISLKGRVSWFWPFSPWHCSFWSTSLVLLLIWCFHLLGVIQPFGLISGEITSKPFSLFC